MVALAFNKMIEECEVWSGQWSSPCLAASTCNNDFLLRMFSL